MVVTTTPVSSVAPAEPISSCVSSTMASKKRRITCSRVVRIACPRRASAAPHACTRSAVCKKRSTCAETPSRSQDPAGSPSSSPSESNASSEPPVPIPVGRAPGIRISKALARESLSRCALATWSENPIFEMSERIRCGGGVAALGSSAEARNSSNCCRKPSRDCLAGRVSLSGPRPSRRGSTGQPCRCAAVAAESSPQSG
mmetsp:Transcript_53319/g.113905  ORF Transcript_53319/g.113905 Transcript_53319/m.113905 type:complete len:201 (-) Transcript_53319:267-869(-)